MSKGDARVAPAEDASSEKTYLENTKLRLETRKLQQDLDFVGSFSTRVAYGCHISDDTAQRYRSVRFGQDPERSSRVTAQARLQKEPEGK
jgi:hypothetical protein